MVILHGYQMWKSATNAHPGSAKTCGVPRISSSQTIPVAQISCAHVLGFKVVDPSQYLIMDQYLRGYTSKSSEPNPLPKLTGNWTITPLAYSKQTFPTNLPNKASGGAYSKVSWFALGPSWPYKFCGHYMQR